MILIFARFFGCRKPECVVLLFWFVRSKYFVQAGRQIRLTFRNYTEDYRFTGLDCSGVTTENSAVCVFPLIKKSYSVVIVTLNDTFLSVVLDIE